MIRPLLASVLFGFLVFPALATRIRPMSLDEIRDASSSVVVVQVTGTSARMGDARMVWTDYEMRVEETLRGPRNAGDVVTLAFAGGRVKGREVGIDGVPRLVTGARYLLFLDEVPGRPVPVTGWGQGIFTVEQQGDSVSMTSAIGDRLYVDGCGVLSTHTEAKRSSVAGESARLSEPQARNGDGSVALQDSAHRATDVPAFNRMREASLDDVRRFVRATSGALRDRRVGE